MRILHCVWILLTLVTFGAAPGAAQEQHDHGAPTGRLGTVHFVTSCNTAVSKDFDRGVAMLHSFWFSAAIDTFNAVLKADPDLHDGALGNRDELVGQSVWRLPLPAGVYRLARPQ